MLTKRRSGFILLAILCILSSCSSQSPPLEYVDSSGQIAYGVLKFPPAKFDHVIWRADGILVAMQDEFVLPVRQPYAFEGDDKLRYLDLEQDKDCVLTKYRFPNQLPDDRLGLIKSCITDNAFTDASYMVAYDWKTGQLEQLVQEPLKHFDIAQCFSWNPGMTEGVQLVSGGLTGTLNWLTKVGPEPVHITLRDGNRAWDLAKDYEENGSIEGGTVSCPDWSPNGEQIAVFVRFDAMGVEGIPRLDKPTKLVLFSPESGQSESVLSGIYYPKSIKWSPNGKYIAFISGELTNNLWVFTVDTKSLMLVDKAEKFHDLSWSPDSKNIAVIWCGDNECDRTEIRKYTLTK